MLFNGKRAESIGAGGFVHSSNAMFSSYIQNSKYSRQSFIKSNIYLPFNPTIPLLGIYLREMKTYVHINSCTGMFIAALLVLATNGKHLSEENG